MSEELEARLREQLTGTGEGYVCRHPDLELAGAAFDHTERRCVLDDGEPDNCDIATDEKLSDKTACPFWLTMNRVDPRPLSMEQSFTLLDALSTLRSQLADKEAEIGRLTKALEPFARVAEMANRMASGSSIGVNIDRCRDARTALTKEGGRDD